jgi:hypothetical protein
MTQKQTTFSQLTKIDISSKVEKKGRFDYLSWAYAWAMVKERYPDANRTVYESAETGLNYFTDGKTGYVKVGVTINGLEHIDYLPIMNHLNRSIELNNITSFEVNKTIQRSTVKAIAMHGLGINLWIGEDLTETNTIKTPVVTQKKEEKDEPFAIMELIRKAKKANKDWDKEVLPYIKKTYPSVKIEQLNQMKSNLNGKQEKRTAVKKA